MFNSMCDKKPCYIWDQQLIEQCDRLPAVLKRASMVHELIAAYDLMKCFKVVRSNQASYEDLKLFHSDLYLNHLKYFRDIEEDYMTNEKDEEFGIGYDCPPVSHIYELVSTLAGGSVTAAKCLLMGISNVVINWCGGWHHAQRFEAQGFCYVNDIVLAIEKLRLKFNRILYIDLDVHHGNGVQEAYKSSKSVFTLSFHKYEPGFFPGTGSLDDIGTQLGVGYKCNFPLHAFYTDRTLEFAFDKVFTMVCSGFKPDAIVMQCGADALAFDPHGGAALTELAYKHCLVKVLKEHKPTILLGGGGYNHPNTARLWANLTAAVAGVTLDGNIPEHDYWPSYGPDYQLSVQPSLTKDLNKEQYLNECVSKIKYTINITFEKKKFLTFNKDKAELRISTDKTKTDHNPTDFKKNWRLNGECDGKDPQQDKIDDLDVYEFHD